MGHRTPKTGVITVASFVEDDKIFYGVSYYSPNELTVPTFDENGRQKPFVQYNKQLGIDLATQRLHDNRSTGTSIPLTLLQHSIVLLDIINDIFDRRSYPDWAEQLLIDNVLYPVGLKRYGKKNKGTNYGVKIVVDSEEAREQLMIASSYIHNLTEVDTDFIAVNILAHLYMDPDSIVVE